MGSKSFLPRNHRFLGRKPKVSRQETFCIKASDFGAEGWTEPQMAKKTHAVRMDDIVMARNRSVRYPSSIVPSGLFAAPCPSRISMRLARCRNPVRHSPPFKGRGWLRIELCGGQGDSYCTNIVFLVFIGFYWFSLRPRSGISDAAMSLHPYSTRRFIGCCPSKCTCEPRWCR